MLEGQQKSLGQRLKLVLEEGPFNGLYLLVWNKNMVLLKIAELKSDSAYS